MIETTQEERDELRDDPNPQPEDVRRVIDDADRLQRAEELLRVVKCPSCDGSGRIEHTFSGFNSGEKNCAWCFKRDAFLGEIHD